MRVRVCESEKPHFRSASFTICCTKEGTLSSNEHTDKVAETKQTIRRHP